jgi:uncharacterized cupin superfamily protein
MTAPRPILLEPHGPAATGMTQWDPIDPSGLTAGEPVQRGHEYFKDTTGTLTAGVWDCTPMTEKFGPYGVNEFMLILEGSVTIVDATGHEETISAGQSFILPKGIPVEWKQTEYVRKYYVIFDDPSDVAISDPAGLKLIRLDTELALPAVGEQDTSRYKGSVPEQHAHSLFKDATAQMNIGLWDTTDMHTHGLPFQRNELMHLLEGSVSFAAEDGSTQTFVKGDTFLVPKGTHYQWDSSGYVRKIYCIFQPT